MKPKRKSKPVRRAPRRSPYERSLEHATHRLNKAIAERETCALKLADLDREIPYLQGVIRALTPPDAMEEWQADVRKQADAYLKAPSLKGAIPDHLKRFIKPVDNGIV